METKKDIRKMMTALRAAMSEKERTEAGRVIAARLFSMKAYEDAGTVCCYAAFGSEVPTEEIIEESLRRGKRVAIPKNEVCSDSRDSRFKSGISRNTGTGILVSGNPEERKQHPYDRARNCV